MGETLLRDVAGKIMRAGLMLVGYSGSSLRFHCDGELTVGEGEELARLVSQVCGQPVRAFLSGGEILLLVDGVMDEEVERRLRLFVEELKKGGEGVTHPDRRVMDR